MGLTSMSVATPTGLLSMPSISRPGSSAWKELAISAIEVNNRCEMGGPKPTPRFAAAMANMKSKDIVMTRAGMSNAKDMVGAMPPLGFWGRLAFFREAELKRGRVCMLASLGFIVSEKFHPFFGGNIEGPALKQFQAVELTRFWPAVLAF